MRNLYIISDTLMPSVIGFCAFWHGVPLPNQEHLISVQFSDAAKQRELEANPNVQAVGHEFDGTAIPDAVATKLSTWGIKKGHTPKDVRGMARQLHKLM